VSFAEAHAYVHLHSDTIDIPICTSEILLRSFSKTSAPGVSDVITPDAPFDKLTALATPAQKAILEGLSKQLEFYGQNRTESARKEAQRVLTEKQKADADRNKTMQEYNQTRQRIATAVQTKWPEFGTPWHPRTQEILKSDSPEVIKAIESHDQYKQFNKLAEQLEAVSIKSLDLDRRWVKCQRFLRTAEDIALAANLTKFAPAEVQERYNELVAEECGTLGGRK
jgi:hypothetical protein